MLLGESANIRKSICEGKRTEHINDIYLLKNSEFVFFPISHIQIYTHTHSPTHSLTPTQNVVSPSNPPSARAKHLISPAAPQDADGLPDRGLPSGAPPGAGTHGGHRVRLAVRARLLQPRLAMRGGAAGQERHPARPQW